MNDRTKNDRQKNDRVETIYQRLAPVYDLIYGATWIPDGVRR